MILVLSLASLAVAVSAFLRNVAPRNRIDQSLVDGLVIPERSVLEGYDSDDRKKLAKHLKAHRLDDQRTLLDLYIRPVLIWNDIIFAVALATFSASLWLWITVCLGLSGWPHGLLLAFAASAVLYGVFDLAEDITLVRLLGDPDAISEWQGQVASLLTRLKALTNGVSLTCAIVFGILLLMTKPKPTRG